MAHLDRWPDEQQRIDVVAQQDNAAHFVFAKCPREDHERAGRCDCDGERKRLRANAAGDRGRLKGGIGEWQSRAATADISGQAVGKERRSCAGAPTHQFVRHEIRSAWRRSDFSIWETRLQDYEAFCRATGRQYEPPDFHQTTIDPAVKVSWFDAVAFCKWLTEKEQNENLIDDREAYRLPTDAERCIAVDLMNESGPTGQARQGEIKNESPWGKRWPPLNDAGTIAGPRRRTTTLPVGSFKSNSIGVFDLANVWQWCLDSYKGDNSANGRDWGVLRGGSWPQVIASRCNPLSAMWLI